jgi:Tfp pilus assembly major pilin PilA
MQDILITLGINAILAAIKGPQKKASLRKAMLKVFRALKVAYANDPDFS